jgi:hypothetical protein
MAGLSKAKRERLANGKCLTGDDNKMSSRGLCSRCLNWVKGQIERGELSEADLIRDGHMLPAKNRGRKAKNALAQQLGKSAK